MKMTTDPAGQTPRLPEGYGWGSYFFDEGSFEVLSGRIKKWCCSGGFQNIYRGLAAVFLLSVLGCGTAEKSKPQGAPLIILGLDGIDWKIIDPLIAQGKLPNLNKLIKGGVRADLETIEPILSPIIWTTVATGKTPEQHGINHFIQKDPGTGRSVPVSSLKRRTKALWNILSDLGHTVGFVGWWASWPAEKINGVIVSDHLTYHGFGLSSAAVQTSEGDTYPADIASRIEPWLVKPADITDEEILEYMHITPGELATKPKGNLDFTNPLHHFVFSLATNRTYEKIALWLLDDLRPRVLGVYMEMPDSVSHLFMKYVPPAVAGLDEQLAAKFGDVVFRAYERQDEVLGELMEKAGPEASFVILSDHGFKTGDRRLVESAHTNIKKAHLWHEKLGVLVLAGPLFEKGKQLEKATVYDIAPTILYALGEKPAADMPGRVLTEAFQKTHTKVHPVVRVDTYEQGAQGARVEDAKPVEAEKKSNIAVDDAVMKRLAALGYIDNLGTREEGIHSVAELAQKNEIKAAEQKIAELVERFAEDAEIQLLAGDVRFRQEGREKEATDHYREAVRVACEMNKPGGKMRCDDILVRVSAVLVERNAIEDAEKMIERLAPFEKHRAITEYMRGLILESRGQAKPALVAYERAIEADPSHVFSLNNAAGCLAEAGNSERAWEYYSRAAALAPLHLESRFNLGTLSLQQKRYHEAVGFFRAVLALNPQFGKVYFPLIQAEIATKKLDEADRDLARFAEVETNRVPMLVLEAALYRARGDQMNATRLDAEASKLDPRLAAELAAQVR